MKHLIISGLRLKKDFSHLLAVQIRIVRAAYLMIGVNAQHAHHH